MSIQQVYLFFSGLIPIYLHSFWYLSGIRWFHTDYINCCVTNFTSCPPSEVGVSRDRKQPIVTQGSGPANQRTWAAYCYITLKTIAFANAGFERRNKNKKKSQSLREKVLTSRAASRYTFYNLKHAWLTLKSNRRLRPLHNVHALLGKPAHCKPCVLRWRLPVLHISHEPLCTSICPSHGTMARAELEIIAPFIPHYAALSCRLPFCRRASAR